MGMTKKEVMIRALRFQDPPYTPWSFGFTQPAAAKLQAHYGRPDIGPLMHNHMASIGWRHEGMTPIGENRVRDAFGVVWDRSID